MPSSQRGRGPTSRPGAFATIPGIGVLNATALVAAVGEGGAFRRGRALAAWPGLVPKPHATGGRPKLLGITRHGNKYLRTLFIHGARAALPSLAAGVSPRGAWLRGRLARTHRNVAIVALARKSSRGSPGQCCAGGGLRHPPRHRRGQECQELCVSGHRPGSTLTALSPAAGRSAPRT
jgi:transposase